MYLPGFGAVHQPWSLALNCSFQNHIQGLGAGLFCSLPPPSLRVVPEWKVLRIMGHSQLLSWLPTARCASRLSWPLLVVHGLQAQGSGKFPRSQRAQLCHPASWPWSLRSQQAPSRACLFWPKIELFIPSRCGHNAVRGPKPFCDQHLQSCGPSWTLRPGLASLHPGLCWAALAPQAKTSDLKSQQLSLPHEGGGVHQSTLPRKMPSWHVLRDRPPRRVAERFLRARNLLGTWVYACRAGASSDAALQGLRVGERCHLASAWSN